MSNSLGGLHRHTCTDSHAFLYGALPFRTRKYPEARLGYVQLKQNELLVLPESLLTDDNLDQFSSDKQRREEYWRSVSWVRITRGFFDSEGMFRNNGACKSYVDSVVDQMADFPDYANILLDLKKEQILDRVQPFYQRWYRQLRRTFWRR